MAGRVLPGHKSQLTCRALVGHVCWQQSVDRVPKSGHKLHAKWVADVGVTQADAMRQRLDEVRVCVCARAKRCCA